MSAKLTTRDWRAEDMPKLAEFHSKMGVGYPLPESFGPLFCVRKAVVDEKGEVVALATVKLVGEAFFWANPEISTLTRAKSVSLLNMECAKAARTLGLEQVSCWIPDRIARCFGKVLEKLGWRKSPWCNWSILLE